MAIGVTYTTKSDERPVGGELIRSDFFTIPGVAGPGTVPYNMVEVPLNVVTAPSLTDPIYVRTVNSISHVPLGPVFTLVTYPTLPLAGQFQVNPAKTFLFGGLLFNQNDAGSTLEIIYTGRGSIYHATDTNDLQDEMTDARGSYSSVGARITAATNALHRKDYVAGTPNGTYTGSLTQFDLPFSYTLTSGRLFVYTNGLLETNTLGYNENTSTRFTFTSALTAGVKVSVVSFG